MRDETARTRHSGSAAVILAVCLALLGCATAAPRPETSPALDEVRARIASTLERDDVFEVRVYGQPNLSGTYRVAGDGSIVFPLLGTVDVAGKTTSEVERELSERLENDYLRRAYVSILIKEFNSKKIFVFGQVQRPGTFPFEENLSLVQALTLAGGFTPQAARDRVAITRRENDRDRRRNVDVEAITKGQAPNPKLMPGDIVFVPEAFF